LKIQPFRWVFEPMPLRGIILKMTTEPNNLTPEEIAALIEVRKGPLSTGAPPEQLEKLVKRGLICKRSMEYILTDAGERALRRAHL